MVIKLFEDTDKINQELASIESYRARLQEICDALKSLGAEKVTARDLQEVVQTDGGAAVVRELVFRGKTLRTAEGFKINPQAIDLEQRPLKTIAKLAQSASRLSINYNLFVVDGGTVKAVEDIEEKVRETHSIYATEKAAAIVKDVTTICELIATVSEKMGVGGIQSYSPLRDPESWFTFKPNYTTGKREYAPNVARIVGHLETPKQSY